MVLCLITGRTHAAPITHLPLPGWIQQVTVPQPTNIDEKDVTDGSHYLLYDEQINIASKEVYCHLAIQLINDIGVQNSSEIDITYNPVYQRLIIHHIRVIRDGKTIDKLDLREIKNIQREKDLNNRIYDGRLTAYISLKDIRKGDLLDYAYTIQGWNPILGKQFTTDFSTEFSTPVSSVHYAVLCPQLRQLNIKQHITNFPVKTRSIQHNTLYELTFSQNKGIDVEESLPNWHFAYGFIEFSEYNNWGEIVDWAIELYRFNEKATPELETKINDLNKGTPEQKIVATLHFIQDEIRYMGFEVGINSHKPNPPALVFNQRFGDCKDKASLMCYMLNQMGIEAYPNLVNSSKTKAIGEWLPSPTSFNHVTVCVILNGKYYWFDPTNSYQGGMMNTIQYPDYSKTLLLKSGEKAIRNIETNRERKTTIHETFVVADTSQPVILSVVTTHSGIEADKTRYQFFSKSLTDIEKEYTDFYKTVYGDVTMTGRIRTFDNKNKNEFEIYEEYSIRDIWNITDTSNGNKVLQVTPQSLFGLISVEDIKRRRSPYGLTFPFDYTQIIEVKFPHAIVIDAEKGESRDEHFNYSYHFRNSEQSGTVLLTYHFETLATVVEPGKSFDFFTKLENLKKLNAFNIPWKQDNTAAAMSDINWIMVFLAVSFSVGFAVLALFLHKKDIAPKHEAEYSQSIGGWLVLIGIGIGVSVLIQLYHLFSQGYFNLTGWIELTSPGKAYYHPLWGFYLIMEMIFKIGFVIFGILLFRLYLRRRSSFPLYYITYLLCIIIFAVLEIVVAYTLPLMNEATKKEALTEIIRAVIMSAIWIPYMLTSWRVRETFVYTYDPANQLTLSVNPTETSENDTV